MDISPDTICGLVLAGGRGLRMDGADKGLQDFLGQPLAAHAAECLRGQAGRLAVSANRNRERYAALGLEAWDDGRDDYPGPLAGIAAGMRRAGTPWLACVPCDAPRAPRDLVARLAAGLARNPQADLAVAADAGGRLQPLFCLARTSLLAGLEAYLDGGGRRVEAWVARTVHVVVPFDSADPAAFANLNTLAQLRALEACA